MGSLIIALALFCGYPRPVLLTLNAAQCQSSSLNSNKLCNAVTVSEGNMWRLREGSLYRAHVGPVFLLDRVEEIIPKEALSVLKRIGEPNICR